MISKNPNWSCLDPQPPRFSEIGANRSRGSLQRGRCTLKARPSRH